MSKDKTPEAVQEARAKVKAEVLALAETIEAGLLHEKKSTVITEKEEGSLYEANLPEGLTPEIVNAVSDYNTTFVAAGAHACGKMAVEAMAKDKTVTEITGQIKMGKRDKVGYTIARSKEYENRLAGDGVKTEKFGVVTTSYEVQGGTNKGQLKAVRNLIGELANAALR